MVMAEQAMEACRADPEAFAESVYEAADHGSAGVRRLPGCYGGVVDDREVVEATGAATLGADLRPLPGLPASEDPLVRQGLRCTHRRLRVQSHRPYTRLHPRRGAIGRDGGSAYRRAHSSENDPPGGLGRMP